MQGYFSLKFDYSLFRRQKTQKTEKTLVMPYKAAKAILSRAMKIECVQSVRRSNPIWQ